MIDINLHSGGFSVFTLCGDCPAKASSVKRCLQAGSPAKGEICRLANNWEIDQSFLLVKFVVTVRGSEPPVAGIMAKIQAHSNTKQINQIQDKPYVVTQKQVQQQHFQKLKVRGANARKGEKSSSESEPFCCSDRCMVFAAFSLSLSPESQCQV